MVDKQNYTASVEEIPNFIASKNTKTKREIATQCYINYKQRRVFEKV
jgi:hypothetical protein